jgi:transcriptional regulator with XRE-family HTH domain
MPRPQHPVRTLAAARGMTLREVATDPRVAISPAVLRNVVSGRMASWPRLRRALADLFEVDERELFPEVAGPAAAAL